MYTTDSNQPEVTVGVISYNGKKVVEQCLDSILSQTYKNLRILLINNASTDGTPERAAEKYPGIEIINYPENRGPNPARNLAITESINDLVLLVDDDAVLEENCIAELVNAAQIYPESAIWSPRIVYHRQKDLIQLEGARLHYLGETILISGDTPLDEGVGDITPVPLVAGITLMVSKRAAISVGLFDEYYFFGRTDGEFALRLTQAGKKIYAVPKAVSYHRVKRRGLSKVFYQIRNRWVLMLTTYSWKTLALISPALFVYEISLIVFLLAEGKISEYIRAISRLASDFPEILEKRNSIQKLRQIPDKEMVHCADMNIRKDLVENKAIAFLKSSLDSFFTLYWKLIYRFI